MIKRKNQISNVNIAKRLTMIRSWAVGVVFTKSQRIIGTGVKILYGIINTIIKFKEILGKED